MSGLRVKRTWTAANLPNGEGPLFRDLARAWEPLAPVTKEPIRMPLAVPAQPKPVARKWFASKRRSEGAPIAPKKAAWTPWLWTKVT